MAEFEHGDSASMSKTIGAVEVEAFAAITGDTNPIHLDDDYACGTRFGRRIAQGMLSAGLISAVLADKLPGPGTIYLKQSLRFVAPVYIGDTITATVTVLSFDPARRRMTLSTVCTNQKGEEVVTGEAGVLIGGQECG
jgi:3-hydroxybutyryl-CoA dehydratase